MFAIFLGLTLLDLLLLWAVVRGRDWWVLKVAAIVLVLGMNFFVWRATTQFSGWPATKSPPAAATLLSCFAVEPTQHQAGRIYLWLLNARTSSGVFNLTPKDDPRAYRMPYDRALHEQCEQAMKYIKKYGVGSIGFGKKTHRKKKGRHNESGWYHFYAVPLQGLPSKDH